CAVSFGPASARGRYRCSMRTTSVSTRFAITVLATKSTTNANAVLATMAMSLERNVKRMSLDPDRLHAVEDRRARHVADRPRILRDELEHLVVVRELGRRHVAAREDDLLPVALHCGDGSVET